MTRPRADVREAYLLQQRAHIPFMIVDDEALDDDPLQIDAPPANHAIDFAIGTSFDDGRECGLLIRRQPRSRATGPRARFAFKAARFDRLRLSAGEVWPKTREQRCWVHKTANVLAKLPKSQQPKAKRALQEIWMAETKAAAKLAFDAFIESYMPKYEKAELGAQSRHQGLWGDKSPIAPWDWRKGDHGE